MQSPPSTRLKEYLTPLVADLTGAKACLVVGCDGLVLAAAGAEAALYIDHATELAATARHLQTMPAPDPTAHDFRGLCVETTRLISLIEPVGSSFFVALLLDDTGITGQARFRLREAIPGLRARLGEHGSDAPCGPRWGSRAC